MSNLSEEEKKAIDKLKAIKVSGDKEIIYNFEAGIILNLIEKQQDIINRIEKYAKGIDDKELLLIVKASNQINDLFYKCKKEGLVDE